MKSECSPSNSCCSSVRCGFGMRRSSGRRVPRSIIAPDCGSLMTHRTGSPTRQDATSAGDTSCISGDMMAAPVYEKRVRRVVGPGCRRQHSLQPYELDLSTAAWCGSIARIAQVSFEVGGVVTNLLWNDCGRDGRQQGGFCSSTSEDEAAARQVTQGRREHPQERSRSRGLPTLSAMRGGGQSGPASADGSSSIIVRSTPDSLCAHTNLLTVATGRPAR